MMSRTSALLTLLAACCTLATSSRVLDPSSAVMATTSFAGLKRSDVVSITYRLSVPPTVSDEFEETWEQVVGKPASKAEGNIMKTLSRPVISNDIYYDYAEWETMEDYILWVTGKHSQDFKDYAADRDIVWQQELLDRVDSPVVKRGGALVNQGSKAHSFAVLSTILVHPHVGENFVQAWQAAAKGTAGESGIETYALSRVAHTNNKFYLYGSWTTLEAWREHQESDYVKQLAHWANNNDVVFVESPLKVLSKV